MGEYLKAEGIDWTYHRDNPSLRLLDEQPDHGCDLCSRFRRRAVYEICRELGANVIAFGHTADDFCESLLRNALFTGRLSALPPVTYSRQKDFRLIRPLVFVTEDITRAYARILGRPVIPCGCSQKTGTVRRSLRDIFSELERSIPHLKENLLSAMGNLEPHACSTRATSTWRLRKRPVDHPLLPVVPNRNKPSLVVSIEFRHLNCLQKRRGYAISAARRKVLPLPARPGRPDLGSGTSCSRP